MHGSWILQPDVEFLQVADIERTVEVAGADDRIAIDRDGRGCFCSPTITGDGRVADQRVDETVCAAEVSFGFIGEGTVFKQNQGAIRHVGLEGGGQVVVVNVIVIRQNTGCGNNQHDIFIGFIRISHSYRRGVGKSRHCDADGGDIAIECAIVRPIGEGIHTAEASVRGVGKGTV